ncbi:MAG: type II toxin-antitoxin system RelE/ParE family toxin [Deltaproteobacteria bacterium]
MPRYRIELSRGAEKALAALPADVQRRIASKIDALAENPRPQGTKKLAGEGNLHRVRVGESRLVYEIRDRMLIVLVLTIGHRREVSRRRG